jgi:Synergist-CTERM protein sorting domain-containing protein
VKQFNKTEEEYKMKKKLSVLALILALVMALAPAASAEMLITRQTGSWSTGVAMSLGIISGDRAEPELQANIGGTSGQVIYQFKNADGKYRVALSLCNYRVPDTINIYAPGDKSGWMTPANWNPVKEFTTELLNIRNFTMLDGAMYAIDYNNAWVAKISTAKDTYAQEEIFKDIPLYGEGYVNHAEAIVAYKGHVYVVVTASKGSYPNYVYAPNRIFKFDKDLNLVAEAQLIGKNMDGGTPGSYKLVGNELFLASLGGNQAVARESGEALGYNFDSCVEAVYLDDLTSRVLLTSKEAASADATFAHNFYAVETDGTKAVLVANRWQQENGNRGHNTRAYVYNVSGPDKGALTLAKSINGADGYRLGIAYEAADESYWIAEGESLWNVKGSDWKKWGPDKLSGSVSYFAVLDPVGATDGRPKQLATESGGGGCNAGFGALFLLSLLPLAAIRKKR